MDLKRKRGDEEFSMDVQDTSYFCMHARHCWLSRNMSTLKLPWDFKLVDQFDFVQKSAEHPGLD